MTKLAESRCAWCYTPLEGLVVECEPCGQPYHDACYWSAVQAPREYAGLSQPGPKGDRYAERYKFRCPSCREARARRRRERDGRE